MQTIGQTLKILREARGMTQKEIIIDNISGTEFMSYSHYCKIESNGNNLTFDKLALLLEKLNCSFDEFNYIRNDYQETNKNTLSDEIYFSYYEGNLKKLTKLKKYALEKFQKNNHFFYKHCYFLCIYLINDKDKNKIEQADKEDIAAYLRNITNYTFYDFKLLCNFYDLLEPKTTFLLADRIIEHFKKYDNFRRKEDDMIFFIMNLIDLSLKVNNMKKAKYYLEFMNKRLRNDYNLIARNGYKFNHALYLIISKEDPELGRKEAEAAIMIFKELDCNNFAEEAISELSAILKKEDL